MTPTDDTRALSENEKAATFIGWEPRGDKWCPICILKRKLKISPITAVPDMSRPENYMRALESIQWARNLAGQWYVSRGEESYKSGWGATPAVALAALYDQEHAND